MADVDGTVVSSLGPYSSGDGLWETAAVDGVLVTMGASDIGGVTYRMRGFDTTLMQQVFWNANVVDSGGTSYAGPGPLTNIVVQKVIGS